MIFFTILFILSVVGIFGLLVKHKEEIRMLQNDISIRHRAPFAFFMESVQDHTVSLWQRYVLSYFLQFTEKRLHRFRIFALRAERFLFRITHRVKKISEKKEYKP